MKSIDTQPASPAASPGFGIPPQTGSQIRKSFVDFFRGKGHQMVPSSPVVPQDDPTLLFINAGMNQFKAALLGENKEGWKRVANSQKCIRVSGKHNDLDAVGRDTYHHTFFEMLGNWSFGDYYKKEAIAWAWELLTEVWKLPKNRLFITVHHTDDESAEIWRQVADIPPHHIMPFGDASNFWEMGDVGPCGPCSEIHFDMGDLETQEATFADLAEGVNGTNSRYIEIWNLVFMQFERLSDGSLKPLRFKNVDTGMGFERIAAIIQGRQSNYDTDVFTPLIQKIAELSGRPYDGGPGGMPHRVIADHVRALSFAIADGASPSNEGRGYVLRRILRRASRYAKELGQNEPFIHKLVPVLAKLMQEAFPEVGQRSDFVAQVIRSEEERFMKTLDQGLTRFNKAAREIKSRHGKEIPGEEIFTLYDTFGFPVDLTQVLAEEQDLTLDMAGYEKHMEQQRDRARSAARFDGSLSADEGWTLTAPGTLTEFIGYETLSAEVKTLRYREDNGALLLVLDKTPFYAEAGGQVGDIGVITGDGFELKVEDTFKILDMTVHKCRVARGNPKLDKDSRLVAQVDAKARAATVRNHSATHLLHAALRQVLGEHVQQQGSRVSPESLRFDFTHFQGITAEELARVEDLVNEKIQENLEVAKTLHNLEEARELGAMALFGEKYGDRVRVVNMGGFSLELCGGTHAEATGQLGLFKIISEGSIASGVRRIEAVTGNTAVSMVRGESRQLADIGRALKAKPGEELAKLEELGERLKRLEKEGEKWRQIQARQAADALLAEKSRRVGDVTVLVAGLDPSQYPKETLTALLDALAPKLNSGIAILTHADAGSLSIMALSGKEVHHRAKAGDLVRELAAHADGKGGGRPERAQAGSKFPEKEALVLREAENLIAKLAGG